MKRSVWKWIFGISLAVLCLLVLFTIAIWVLLNIGGAIFLALLGNAEMTGIPFSVFMANFVGSPLFYVYLADLFAMLAGIIGMAVTKEKPLSQ